MVNKKELLRLMFGILWIFAGLGKIVQLVFADITETMTRFTDNCMFEFYAELIESIAIPNVTAIFILLAFAETGIGLLILSGRSYTKLGLLGATLINLAYSPLFSYYTILVNVPFIIPQIYLLMQKDLNKNYLSGLMSRK